MGVQADLYASSTVRRRGECRGVGDRRGDGSKAPAEHVHGGHAELASRRAAELTCHGRGFAHIRGENVPTRVRAATDGRVRCGGEGRAEVARGASAECTLPRVPLACTRRVATRSAMVMRLARCTSTSRAARSHCTPRALTVGVVGASIRVEDVAKTRWRRRGRRLWRRTGRRWGRQDRRQGRRLLNQHPNKSFKKLNIT